MDEDQYMDDGFTDDGCIDFLYDDNDFFIFPETVALDEVSQQEAKYAEPIDMLLPHQERPVDLYSAIYMLSYDPFEDNHKKNEPAADEEQRLDAAVEVSQEECEANKQDLGREAEPHLTLGVQGGSQVTKVESAREVLADRWIGPCGNKLNPVAINDDVHANHLRPYVPPTELHFTEEPD